MEPPEEDHYAVLGVARDATAPEVRKAYLRLVREHPPEEDAEAFGRIAAAYAVLGHPEKRASYDAAASWPEEARVAADQAIALAQKGEFAAACDLLAPVVPRHPRLRQLARLEAHLLLGAERHAEARDRCRRLVAEDPNDAYAAYWLAVAEGNDAQHGDPAEAERLLKHAVVLDPDEADFAIGLGRCLVRLGRPVEAVAAMERALARPAIGTPERLSMLAELLRITVFAPGPLAPDEVEARLIAIGADIDGPTKGFVCGRLWQLAGDFERESRHVAAARLVETVVKLDPENRKELTAIAARLRDTAAAAAERDRFLTDESQAPWLRELVRILTMEEDAARRDGCEATARARIRDARPFADDERDIEQARRAYPRLMDALGMSIAGVLSAVESAISLPLYVPFLSDPDVPIWIKELLLTQSTLVSAADSARRRRTLIRGFRSIEAGSLRSQFDQASARHGARIEHLRDELDALLAVAARGPEEDEADGDPAPVGRTEPIHTNAMTWIVATFRPLLRLLLWFAAIAVTGLVLRALSRLWN